MLLDKDSAPESNSPQEITKHIQITAMQDQRALHNGTFLSWPAAGALALIFGTFAPIEFPPEKVATALSGGCLVSAAYLTQICYEGRKKIQSLRKTFSNAAAELNNGQKHALLALTDALERPQDTWQDALNIKKYPARNAMTYIFTAFAGYASFTAPTLLGAAIPASFAALSFTSGLAFKEAKHMEHIEKMAENAQESLRFNRVREVSRMNGDGPPHDPRFGD